MREPDSWVTIPDPDDPFGPPIYEGPPDDAYKHLIPGIYQVSAENARADAADRLLLSVDASSLLVAGRASSPLDGRPRAADIINSDPANG